MRALMLCLVLLAVLGLQAGCARHTYLVETMDRKLFYVDPPLVLDAEKGVYSMWIKGQRRIVPMDQIYRIDDAAQVCYQNGVTDTFTCYDNLYTF
ncbi:hypothetical protein [Solidesulfovibrio sp.]